MNTQSLVFSHQYDTVLALSKYFETVTVFTLEKSREELPRNITEHEIPWKKGVLLRNLISTLILLIPYLVKNRKSVLFSHMTDVHSAVLSPITKLLGIRHVLWYAHAENSKFVRWASLFVSKVVTSTPGSCNIKLMRHKLITINQGIDPAIFPFKPLSLESNLKLFNFGRLDKSKNIHLFEDVLGELLKLDPRYTLTVFGNSSGRSNRKYIEETEASLKKSQLKNCLQIFPPLPRKLISNTTSDFGVFLNLFSGSLDKTLVECTLMGKHVVTWNQEYCHQFGTWSGQPPEPNIEFIIDEFLALRNLEDTSQTNELLRRYRLAMELHTFDLWIENLVAVLKTRITK